MMKANIVIQKAKGQVIKICNSPKMFKKELYIYEKKLPFTPKLLDHDGKNTLMLEYIDGIPLIDLLKPDFARVAELIAELHELENKSGKVICHIDNNPMNFIYSKGMYYMFDFSEWEYDLPEKDLIHFLLFWASIYDTNKFESVHRSIINGYKKIGTINPLEWELLIPGVIERFDSRRRKFGKKEKNPDIVENRELIKNIYF